MKLKLNPLLSYYNDNEFYYFFNKYDENKSTIFKAKEIFPEKINRILHNKIGINAYVYDINYFFYDLLCQYIDNANEQVNKSILSAYLLRNLSQSTINIFNEANIDMTKVDISNNPSIFTINIVIRKFLSPNEFYISATKKGIFLNFQMNYSNTNFHTIGPFLEITKSNNFHYKDSNELKIAKTFNKSEIQFSSFDLNTQLWNLIAGAIIDYFSDYIARTSICFDRKIIVHENTIDLSEKIINI